MVKFKTKALLFNLNILLLPENPSSFWPKVFVIALKSWFFSFLNCLLKCASVPVLNWAITRSSASSNTQNFQVASAALKTNNNRSKSARSLIPQGEAWWWGGGVRKKPRIIIFFFFNPSYLPTTNGLFSAPNGFCLTNGVSFLQRYDPGLVVVMVNLAVVIFYFQTELLLLSSVHQYVRLTFSVVAIILLLGLSFSFPFLSLCTLVWSLFIKGYC